MLDAPQIAHTADRLTAVIHLTVPRAEVWAWGEFEAWIAAQGHTAAPDLWECYVVGPEANPDPASWRTELNRPLTA